MPRHHHEFAVAAGAFAQADDIAFRIDRRIAQAGLAKPTQERLGAKALSKWRRRDFGQGDDVIDHAGIPVVERPGRGLECLTCDNPVRPQGSVLANGRERRQEPGETAKPWPGAGHQAPVSIVMSMDRNLRYRLRLGIKIFHYGKFSPKFPILAISALRRLEVSTPLA